MAEPIGNPLTWTVGVLDRGSRGIGAGAREIGSEAAGPIEIAHLEFADLGIALRKGVDDFKHFRTDVMFLVVIYPIIGVLLVWLALHRELLHLVFPIVAGFALLGPVAAIGLYELSRRRERGDDVGWTDALGVMVSPSFIPIVVLGGFLVGIFLVWIYAALSLYDATLGPAPQISASAFLEAVFTTGPGWTMLVVGLGVGLLFAIVVLAISIVSFPLLLDRHVGVPAAVVASVRVSLRNPGPVAAWGALVLALLALGAATLLLGLVFVLPILGHATWHLYRRAVLPPGRPGAG